MIWQRAVQINNWFIKNLDIEPMAVEISQLIDGIVLEQDFDITISGVDFQVSHIYNDSQETYEMPYGNKIIFLTLN